MLLESRLHDLLSSSWRRLAVGPLLALLVPASATALEVSGRVVDPGGSPISGATIEAQRIPTLYQDSLRILEGKVTREAIASVRTSADGEFRIRVPEAGMWQFEVSAEGRVPVRCSPTPLLRDERLVNAVLEADAGLEVRIEDPTGAVFEGAQVWAQPMGPQWRSRRRARRSPWSAIGRYGRTGGDGLVRLARKAGQEMKVHAFGTGFAAAEPVETDAARVTVRLRAGEPVTVQLTDAGGAPIAAAALALAEADWVAVATGEAGEAVISVVPEERTSVSVQLETGQIEATVIEVPARPEGQGQSPLEHAWRLPAAVELTGRVIDQETRDPLAGALVWTSTDKGRYALSGRDGAFRLVRGSGEGWGLQGAAAGYSASTVAAQRLPDGVRVPTLALARAGVVSGRVVDDLGEPIAGAELSVGPRLSTRSGSDGSFRLEGLRFEPRLILTTEAIGFATDHRRLVAGAVTDLEVVLEHGRSVTGRLVDPDGEPVVGGTVFATRIEPDPRNWSLSMEIDEIPEAESAADGRFRLDDLPQGPLALLARREGLAPATVRDLPFDEGQGLVLELGDIELGWGVTLDGVVKARDDAPIAGAKVTVYGATPGLLGRVMFRNESPPRTETDSAGRFTVDGLSATVRHNASVKHPDYVERFVSEIDPSAEEPLEIVLDRGARVSGRVIDGSGEPLAGVGVVVMTTPTGDALELLDRARMMARTVSESDGSFEVGGVSPGRLEVSVQAGRGWRVREPVTLDLAAGEERTGVELHVTRGSTLTGMVSDGDGRPVSGATVEVQSGSPSRATLSMTLSPSRRGSVRAMTDGDGRYLIQGLDAETPAASVAVRHPDFALLEQAVELRAGENRLDLALSSGVSITGRVVNETGEAVEGAQIEFDRSTGMFRTISFDGEAEATSQRDGSFEISGVGAGVHRLVARGQGYAQSAVEEVETSDSAGADVTLVLRSGGTLRGRLLGLEPEELVQVNVFASSKTAAGEFAAGIVGSDGEYRVENISFSEGQVMASIRRGGQTVVEEFTMDTRGGETWLDLEFGRGATLTGIVRANGAPMSGVHVIAMRAGAPAGSASTDQAGRFAMRGLEDGTYQVMVRPIGRPSHVEQVTVAGETETSIDISTVSIIGRVVAAADARPISGAQITVTVSDDPIGQYMPSQVATTVAGDFEAVVPAGRTVTVRAKADGYAEAALELDTGAGVDIPGVELVLAGAGLIELDVALWTGARPDLVSVALIDSAGNRVLADNLLGRPPGTFKLTSAPTGEWTLLVASMQSAVVARKVTVPGPQVDLVLPQGATIRVEVSSGLEVGVGATVRLISPDGGFLRLPSFGSVLSEIPLFASAAQIRFVPPGDWVVELVDGAGAARRQSVNVAPGQTATVSFD